MALRAVRLSQSLRVLSLCQTRCMSDVAGSGAGKGGGSGGNIRDAGGSFGKREAALENQYFKKMQEEQLKALRDEVADEIKHHSKQIEEHKAAEQFQALNEHHQEEIDVIKDKIHDLEDAIDRHKSKLKKLKKMSEESD